MIVYENSGCKEDYQLLVFRRGWAEVLFSVYTVGRERENQLCGPCAFLMPQDVLKALHSDLIHLFKNCQDLVKFGSGRGQRAAYVTFADLLMVFAKQLRKFPHLASLVYVPDANLQRTLQVLYTTVHWCIMRLSAMSIEAWASLSPSLPLSVPLLHHRTTSWIMCFSLMMMRMRMSPLQRRRPYWWRRGSTTAGFSSPPSSRWPCSLLLTTSWSLRSGLCTSE